MNDTPSPAALRARLRDEGFAFVDAAAMRALLALPAPAWPAFAASWDRLGPDPYLAAVGRARLRRHATYRASPEGIRRQPHRAHYQSLTYNPLQGGQERWFEPVEPELADGLCMERILAFCHALFGALAPATPGWHIEVHQFRIEARDGDAGEPTPEGVHRDGVDFVLVLLIDRANIESGTTTIHAPDGALLGSFTLTDPLDAALVDDARVCHGVTAVVPRDPSRPAHRDVLVVTFRATAK